MTSTFDNKNFQLALDYAPADYAVFDAKKSGRWRTYSQNGRLLGVIYLDDDEEATGFLQGDNALLPGSHQASVAANNLIRIMKTQDVPAPVAYMALQQTPGVVVGKEQRGLLRNAIELAQTMSNDDAMTAAAETEAPAPAVYFHVAFHQDTEEFLELIRSDVRGLHIYDNGDWHLLPEDDATVEYVETMEWITIAESDLLIVTKVLDAGNEPTREDVLPHGTDYK